METETVTPFGQERTNMAAGRGTMMAKGMMILAANEGISSVRQTGYWVGSFDLPASLFPLGQGKKI